MKLIIDIDENVFTRLFDNGIQDNEISVDDICEMARALRLGTPLSEELEKIKAEIRGRCIYSIGKIDVLDIIDNHIKEIENGNPNR